MSQCGYVNDESLILGLLFEGMKNSIRGVVNRRVAEMQQILNKCQMLSLRIYVRLLELCTFSLLFLVCF